MSWDCSKVPLVRGRAKPPLRSQSDARWRKSRGIHSTERSRARRHTRTTSTLVPKQRSACLGCRTWFVRTMRPHVWLTKTCHRIRRRRLIKGQPATMMWTCACTKTGMCKQPESMIHTLSRNPAASEDLEAQVDEQAAQGESQTQPETQLLLDSQGEDTGSKRKPTEIASEERARKKVKVSVGPAVDLGD